MDRTASIRTNWIVFTGTSCAGKTTLLNRLSALGGVTTEEASRAYLREKETAGFFSDRIRANEAAFQHAVLDRKLRTEARLDPFQRVFLDRAVPDSISYFRNAGLDVDTVQGLSTHYEYAAVFLFSPLPLVPDPARTETAKERLRLQHWLMEDYQRLGYAPIIVPVLPVDERLAFVLDAINAQDLLPQQHRVPFA